MDINTSELIRYGIYFIVYMFSCRLALELLSYLGWLVKTNCFQGSGKLRKQFIVNIKPMLKPSDKYKERNKELEPGKK